MNKFNIYTGNDLMGLKVDNNYLVFKVNDPDCKILLAVTRKGNSLFMHFASDKKGLPKLKTYMPEFEKFLFDKYKWCEFVMASIHRKSIARLAKQLGCIQVYRRKNDKYSGIWIKAR